MKRVFNSRAMRTLAVRNALGGAIRGWVAGCAVTFALAAVDALMSN